MGRPPRIDVSGYAYHVLNRAVGRRSIFEGHEDFSAFERVLASAIDRSEGAVELLAYCVMPNHWHLVLRTTRHGALSPFMKWLTLTHTQRYRFAHDNVGDGPLYRGRFKSFIIETDRHFLTVCRYVERNAARAGLVARAEDWRWSSLWRSRRSDPSLIDGSDVPLVLSDWPLLSGRPRNWMRTVNTPLNTNEYEALQRALKHSRPFGNEGWVRKQEDQFGLPTNIRPPGRPKQDTRHVTRRSQIC